MSALTVTLLSSLLTLTTSPKCPVLPLTLILCLRYSAKLVVLKTLSSTGLEQSMTKERVTFCSALSFLILAPSLGTVLTGAYFVAITNIFFQQLLINIRGLPNLSWVERLELTIESQRGIIIILDNFWQQYPWHWKRMSFSYMFKFIIIGDTGVGKSCLLLQFIDHRFRQKHEVTIGVEFGAKMITVGDKTIKLQIWDTAGQESFKSITRGYYRSAAGAILVYDITNRESFNNVSRWLQEAKINGNSQMVFVVVGNKCDMESERKVSYEQGAKFAKDNNLVFLQVSAKTAYQVQDSFKKNAQLLLDKIQKGVINMDSQPPGIKRGNVSQPKVKLDITSESSKPEKKKCC